MTFPFSTHNYHLRFWMAAGGVDPWVPDEAPGPPLEPLGADEPDAGGKPGRPLSNMALLALLRRMERPDLTVHGFRSAFRDWAAEQTNFPHEVCNMALAHAISDKVERAYRRGDLFAKRRQLMEAWARFCLTPSLANSEVIAFPLSADTA